MYREQALLGSLHLGRADDLVSSAHQKKDPASDTTCPVFVSGAAVRKAFQVSVQSSDDSLICLPRFTIAAASTPPGRLHIASSLS